MTEEKRLILRILQILELIETPQNQPRIREIKGLLYELLENI